MTTGPDSTPRVEEQLSAWLDDELSAGELELLAARLLRAPEQRARVARYALVGSHLRARPTGNLASELLALRLGERVRAAIEGPDEPARVADSRLNGRSLPYAVAAGIALLAVALVPLVRLSNDSAPVDRQIAESSIPLAVATPVSLSSNRMTSYLVYHGEYSGMLSAKVMDSHIVNHRTTVIPAAAADGLSAR